MLEKLLMESVVNAPIEYNKQGMIEYSIDDAVDGWRIDVRSKYDDSPDTSYLGDYTDNPSGWYIDRKTGNLYHDDKCIRKEIAGNDWERGEYQYYVYPWETATIKDVLRDYSRLESINRGDVVFIGIIVTVHLEGVELGFDGLWGIESDSDEDYISDMIHDVASSAISEAMNTMESLKAKIC